MPLTSRARHIFLLGITLLLVVGGCEREALGPQGVVGVFGGVGLGDGDFSYPRAIAAEPAGSILVVDKSGRIQRFNAAGEFEFGWRTPEIEYGKPVGISVHRDGRIFVPDTHYHRVLIYSREGELLESFGELGSGDGQFQLPTDVAFDAAGFIYVSEYHDNDRVTKWSPELKFVQSIGIEPVDGIRLRRPAAIDIDAEQTLWVADACNHRVVRFSLEGEVLSWFGEFGSAPGQLRYPYDLCITPDDNLLVCEYEGNRLQWFDKQGRSLRCWGSPGRVLGQLSAPWGATLGPEGRLYVLDSLNSRVQIVKP